MLYRVKSGHVTSPSKPSTRPGRSFRGWSIAVPRTVAAVDLIESSDDRAHRAGVQMLESSYEQLQCSPDPRRLSREIRPGPAVRHAPDEAVTEPR